MRRKVEHDPEVNDAALVPGPIAPSVAATQMVRSAGGRGAQKHILLGVPAGLLALLLGAAVGVAMLGCESQDREETAREPPHDSTEADTAPEPPPPACPEGMVLIAATRFTMGGPGGDARPHEVELGSYCIDRTEVTVAAYGECLRVGRCRSASGRGHCNERQPGRARHPINCVSWTDANGYCEWRGARLPTEAEWELAARGKDGRLFPWGQQEPDASRLNARDIDARELIREGHPVLFEASDGWGSTAPVSSFPRGASAWGVMDMAGNVWEWTADWYGPYPSALVSNPVGPAHGTERVARGGSWSSNRARMVRAITRSSLEPSTTSSSGGFRCAANVGARSDGQPPAPPPTPTITAAAVPSAPASNHERVAWVPLQRPWTRLLYFGDQRDLDAEESLTWIAPGGPAVVLTVPEPRTHDSGEENWGLETTVTLRGVWPGSGGPRVLMRYPWSLAGPSAADCQDLVVYAGIREDGLLLVSMEALPQRGLMELPGHSKRVILGWNAERNGPRAMAHWEGPTRDVPQLFRIRPPR